jgi:ribosome-associated toxin RatA of RatAB toxin-antitoxin module
MHAPNYRALASLALALGAATAAAASPTVSPSAKAPPWTEVQDEEGIKVWTRPVPGSHIREVKAHAIVEAKMDRVWHVVSDLPHFHEYMPYIIQSRQLKQESEDTTVEYHQLDPPFVSKRDYILRVKADRKRKGGPWTRTWTVAPNQGPAPHKGFVRLQIVDGSWTLKPLGPNRTDLTYRVYTDPGGSIPTWLANRANTTAVPNLLKAVQARSLDPQWRD